MFPLLEILMGDLYFGLVHGFPEILNQNLMIFFAFYVSGPGI